ncbi:MAG: ribonuclease R [Lachnospirales bacterium]
MDRKEKILALIKDDNYKPIKAVDIAFFMEVPKEETNNFMSILGELESEGKVIITKKGKVLLPEREGIYTGVYLSTSRGFGFVDVEGLENDIFIPRNCVNGALYKDVVLVKLESNRDGKKPEGEIIKILQGNKDFIVGTYEQGDRCGFVIPDNDKYMTDIYIGKSNKGNAVDGSKVMVRIIKRDPDAKNPEGEILNIIGHKNDPGVDILSIVYDYEIPLEFPDKVMTSLYSVPDELEKKEYSDRLDLRRMQTITIDGEDAKDLDDAISIEKLGNGNYKLGVHIADVTNYVKEDSFLDKEARKRGTSVYLVDRVIPMLPHKLSNGICSLNAGVDRFALSCIMEIDGKGEVVKHEIAETLIKTDKRLSYTIVNDILTNDLSQYKEEYKNFVEMFKNMEKLRGILLNKRLKRGSIEFNFPEAKIILDEKGKPLDIVKRERNIATSIIEEFMLVCNETVAEDFFWMEVPFVFRTHEEPSEEKINKLKDFISTFGYFIKGNSTHPKALQGLLTSLDTKEEALISKVVLRSMQQAKYTAKNGGHYGLAAKYYCHFTSPIRRYPDLQIHRIIKENLKGKLDSKEIKRINEYINEVCANSSFTERRAENAERDTNKLKKCEYMEDKIGSTFGGIISGVTSWGLYVELDNTVEGMVPVTSLNNDNYVYDELNLAYKGEKYKYTIGSKVTVYVDKVDIARRNIDFLFIDEKGNIIE